LQAKGFIGMAAIGSKEIKAALEKVSSKDLKKAAEGLSIAAGIEAESISFYERQAANFKGKEAENFFRFLAGQEREHMQAIKALKEGLEKQGKWLEVAVPESKRPEIFSEKDWDKGRKEGLTAVLFALWKEKQAQEFYEGIAERVENSAVKNFFNALAEFEKGHADLLSEYVEDSYYSRELIMG
jgi:rubrerythrin